MSSTGLLVVSNLKNISSTLSAVKNHVKSLLYIHLNVPKRKPPTYSAVISEIYRETLSLGQNIDVRVLVTPLKNFGNFQLSKDIDILLFDTNSQDICEDIKRKYKINLNSIVLNEQICDKVSSIPEPSEEPKTYENVVLGGTFDRIHLGHKILLTEAVLRAQRRLVVGVTAKNMLKSKVLPELILPVEQRIKDVRDFLNDIDSSLLYEVVPIKDIFGPTKSDPEMDMIVVSAETARGANKINEVRALGGLKALDVHEISLVEFDTGSKDKEMKISSSNNRMDLLGTRIRDPEPKRQLQSRPYIIGLTGGIASGKTHMAERLQKLGAKVIDCDKLAHEVYEPGTDCFTSVIKRFGEGILAEDGRIDRKKLGQLVFNDQMQLRELSELVWPFIMVEAKNLVKKAYADGFEVVILDAAVLLQANWQNECHEVWSMIIPPDEAIKRLKIRNNLTEQAAKKRLASQLDNESVVQQSNVIFCALWSYEFSQEQAERAWRKLMEREFSKK